MFDSGPRTMSRDLVGRRSSKSCRYRSTISESTSTSMKGERRAASGRGTVPSLCLANKIVHLWTAATARGMKLKECEKFWLNHLSGGGLFLARNSRWVQNPMVPAASYLALAKNARTAHPALLPAQVIRRRSRSLHSPVDPLRGSTGSVGMTEVVVDRLRGGGSVGMTEGCR
jgi:hypothetical protein